MPKNVDREVLAGYIEEVNGYLPEIQKSFSTLDVNPKNMDCLEEAHRFVHSIKGAASMIGLSGMSHTAHLLEEALEEVASGQLPWTAGTHAVFSGVTGQIAAYASALATGKASDTEFLAPVIKSFRRLRNQPESGDEAEIASLLGAEVVETRRSGPVKSQLGAIAADVLDTFGQEAEEHLHIIGEGLRRFEKHPQERDVLQNVRRSVHTLKGAAASVGLAPLATLAHRMEDLLEGLDDNSISYSSEIVKLLFATFDTLGDIASGAGGSSVPERGFGELYDWYARVLDGSPASARPAPATGRRTPQVVREEAPAELMETFRSEAEEHLHAISSRLRDLEKDPSQREPIQSVRRSVHTLKGAAAMIGIHAMSQLAHRMEDLLDLLWEGSLAVTPEVQKVLFRTADTLADMAASEDQAGAVANAAVANVDDLEARYDALLGEPGGATPRKAGVAMEPLGEEKVIDLAGITAGGEPAGNDQAEHRQKAPAQHSPSQFVRVPIERLDELVRLVSELVVNRSTFEQHLSAYIREVEELGLSVRRLKRVSGRLDTDFEVSALKGGFGQLAVRAVDTQPAGGQREFDALEFDQYSNFHIASRDLSETSSDLSSAAGELSNRIGDFDGNLNRLGRLTSEIQDKLMRMRMVPLLTLTTRLHRTVRVAGESCGKTVDLVIEGEHIELDKTVLEEMAGPLEHLLRNAADHGIEGEALRRAVGKPGQGQIRLRAYNEGTQVVIEVRDDGGGMEPQALRAAAVRAGMYTETEAALLANKELYELIFHPGFSTARELSEISGRGVGMDIVRSTVHRLKGTISVDTQTGIGTVFTIQLPMTLAITRVLLVKSGRQTYALPLAAVSQILRVDLTQVERVGSKPVIRVEGKAVPAIHLCEALGTREVVDHEVRKVPVVILRLGDRRLALMVDQLMEAREIVVKNLGTLMRRVRGIAGGTLMGNGDVVLIVNPADLMEESKERSVASGSTPMTMVPARRPLNVLIVDDSVSVRRVLSNLIKNTGWLPSMAKDGMEALEHLHRGAKADVILLDIEMPRMDGYELTSALRSEEKFKEIPIIMLTSRAGEKHRRKAFDLGATDYLVKPYQDETLLAVIRRVVREYQEVVVE